MKQQQSVNFIDLFSGAGGLSNGMEMAGWNCLLGVDFNDDAIKSFELNHKNAKGFCGDITTLTHSKIKKLIGNNKVHAVVGGPPCQGFSTVGLGNPKDKRNSLFMEFVRIVKETNPYFIVVENVTGLLAKKNEKTLKKILSKFEKLGYELNFKVMSSEQYGVPERRRRTIIIGSKINSQVDFPVTTHNCQVGNYFIPAVTVGDAFQKLNKKKKLLNHTLKAAKISKQIDLKRIKKIPEGKGIRYKHDEDSYLCKKTKLDVDWDTITENRLRQTRYQRLDRNKTSPTILTSRTNYYHPTEDRYLTPREAATLQSFPHNFEFYGSTTSQWKQIGNAVPPLMGKAIGKALLKMMDISKSSKCSNKNIKKKPITIKSVREKAFHYKKSPKSTTAI